MSVDRPRGFFTVVLGLFFPLSGTKKRRRARDLLSSDLVPGGPWVECDPLVLFDQIRPVPQRLDSGGTNGETIAWIGVLLDFKKR